jgi:hypothetical protein
VPAAAAAAVRSESSGSGSEYSSELLRNVLQYLAKAMLGMGIFSLLSGGVCGISSSLVIAMAHQLLRATAARGALQEHLSELELEIRKLNDKVKDVLAEQAYQRTRELEFRKTSEAIHSKQQYWSLFQIAVSCAAAYIQVTALQRFFRGKKMV